MTALQKTYGRHLLAGLGPLIILPANDRSSTVFSNSFFIFASVKTQPDPAGWLWFFASQYPFREAVLTTYRGTVGFGTLQAFSTGGSGRLEGEICSSFNIPLVHLNYIGIATMNLIQSQLTSSLQAFSRVIGK